MNALLIPQAEFTPLVHFNPENRLFILKGISRPENVLRFYGNILEWLKEYEELSLSNRTEQDEPIAIKVEFRLNYFNSSSAKSILQLLEMLKSFGNYKVEISIDFYYDEGDEQMRDDGEELSEAVEMPFNYHIV